MKNKVMEVPFSYEEAMRLYHAAQQVGQDFFDFSPYYMFLSNEEREDKVKAYVLTSLRRGMLETAGVSIRDREELLVCKNWIVGSTPVEYILSMYRDPLEDEGYCLIEIMAEFMVSEGISEYEIRPSALFGEYLLNRDIGTDIRETLRLLERTLEERTEEGFFYECSYVTHPTDYGFDEEEEPESEFTLLSIEEQRSGLLQFIREYRLCLDGAPIGETCFLGIMKRYLAYMDQYYMDDTTFLNELPGLCVLHFGGPYVSFRIGEDVCMMGNAQRDVYLIEDRDLAEIVKMHPDKEDVQAIAWCLDQMCDSGQRADSSYLRALAGWRCTDKGIVFSEIFCRDTDMACDLRIGISMFSAFLAPMILDAVSEHAKMSYLCGDGGTLQDAGQQRPSNHVPDKTCCSESVCKPTESWTAGTGE